MTAPPATDEFHVEPWMHVLGGFVARHPRLWTRLGNLETRLLADALEEVVIEAPIYVAGLARSGSTLLLELLDWHDEVATHRYRDFPMLDLPYAWDRFLAFTPQREQQAVERGHRDRIWITPESPEAFEEVLWMRFFPTLHDPELINVLDERTDHLAFASYYADHMRKLLLARSARRYVSKGNYNLTRLEYLLKLFPDARFVVPVRDPVWHVASLIKQHRLFCENLRANPKAVAHLQRVGHFEFGPDRRPVNAGDSACVRRIVALWSAPDTEVEGWALYWAHLHGWLADRLAHNAALREATLVVNYQALCDAPGERVQELYAHCRLNASDALIARARERIGAPAYYRPDFTADELAAIEHHTAATAARLGLNGR